MTEPNWESRDAVPPALRALVDVVEPHLPSIGILRGIIGDDTIGHAVQNALLEAREHGVMIPQVIYHNTVAEAEDLDGSILWWVRGEIDAHDPANARSTV